MARLGYLLAIPLALISPARVALPAGAVAAGTEAGAASAYSQSELEQLLAPIALYPDDLLVQVLVASTYPLEVAMADRWVQQPTHKELKGDALLKALDAEDWDPSVKSLVPFPDVLRTMSDQLDWTQKLGDAFLAQQSDVFAAVQALRGRANQAGTLKSTPQQTVVQEGSAIVIQPAQPATVYVPAYDPNVAYGTWPYPASPPAYYPPPPGTYLGSALATGLAFGAGVAITGALWGWGSANWGGGTVNVNANRFNEINANRSNNFQSRSQAVTSGTWSHNAEHRRGVVYSNDQVRQNFRGNAAGDASRRESFRGREGAAGGGLGGDRAAVRPAGGGAGATGQRRETRQETRGASSSNAGSLGQRAQGAQTRPGGGNTADLQNKLKAAQRPSGGGVGGGSAQPRNPTAQRQPAGGARGNAPAGGQRVPQRTTAQRPANGGAAFKGVGNASGTRAASAQGRASRGGAAGGGRAAGGGGRQVQRGGRR